MSNYLLTDSSPPRKFSLPVLYHSIPFKERRLVREEYASRQDGKCYHCGQPLIHPPAKEILEAEIDLLLFPPNFLKYPQHLHHDHKTGLTIGTVHSRCNAYLFQYLGE